MALIAILLSLMIEHFYDQSGHWQRYDWFHGYVEWLRARLPGWAIGYVELILILLPWVLGLLLIDAWFFAWSWGLLELMFSVFVLVICLGPKDLRTQIEEYRHALESHDDGRAQHLAQQWLDELPTEEDEQHRAVLKAMFVAANVRIFGVLCWFILLGPLGAVLYRAIKELSSHAVEGDLALNMALERVAAVVDWLPTRMAAAGFALAGHFDNALRAWRNNHHSEGWAAEADSLLDDVGAGALDVALPESWPPVFIAVEGLIRRTLIILLFVLAVLTIAGWLS